ncbi:MAG: RNA polymerase subunit sigma [Rhodopirellula sp.]|nr:RNA polymerase subunit sigma [Rhodopirellula sp.]
MAELQKRNGASEDSSYTTGAELLNLVYSELRQVAALRLAAESPGNTLQPTALVHEAYLRLTESEKIDQWQNRKHFFSAACIAMRRILVERARAKKTLRRGGAIKRVPLEGLAVDPDLNLDLVLTIHSLLESFEKRHPRKAKLVELRFFAGLTIVEAAEMLQISVSMADQDWRFSRAWLRVAMEEASPLEQ